MDGDRYNFPSSPEAHPDAIVTGDCVDEGKYRFTVLAERLLRYEWSKDGGFEDRVSTLAVFRRFDVPKFRCLETKDSLEIITEFFHLYYDKKQFTTAGLAVTVTLGNDTWRYDGQNYGDLGGTARTLDGAAGRIPLEPGILSRKPYAALDDSKSMLFDEKGWIGSRVPDRNDGYVFSYSRDHKAAIKDFYRLSGRQPLLPRWALGNWWSRYHAYSAAEYLGLIDHFERENIPLTVGVLDMDWHRVDDVPAKYGSGWTGYSWNRELFPDPETFLEKVRKRGLKIAVNDHPADGIRAFEDLYQDVAEALDFDTSNGDPIRFDCADKRFIDAYFDVLKQKLEKQGLDFWWVDWQQGTDSKVPGIDPLWVLNHYHYLTSRRSIKSLGQPLTFSRYAGPGSHRYPIGFSGDTLITWDSLAFQPEFTATASNIGYGWWSHDIGGHFWGSRSNELTARWVQLGCFSPILRLHSEKSQWNSKEPWKYEQETCKIMMKYLQIRHRLIPFLASMNVRAHYDHEPLIQPMYWNHQDEEAYKVPNQYYFGPDLIVAPITTPNSKATLLGQTTVWLPPGRYIDICHPQLVYDGSRMIKVHRTLGEIPIFAKEGTILPYDLSPLSHGAKSPTHLAVHVVVGKDAIFHLYEEGDGKSTTTMTDKDSFLHTVIHWNQAEGSLTIKQNFPRKLQWSVMFVGHNGANANSDGLPHDMSVWPWTELGVIVDDDTHKWVFGKDLQLNVVDIPARIHEMLYRCETDYQKKEVIWKLITEDSRPTYMRLIDLMELDLEPELLSAIEEIWFADGRALKERQGDSSIEQSHQANTRKRTQSQQGEDLMDDNVQDNVSRQHIVATRVCEPEIKQRTHAQSYTEGKHGSNAVGNAYQGCAETEDYVFVERQD